MNERALQDRESELAGLIAEQEVDARFGDRVWEAGYGLGSCVDGEDGMTAVDLVTIPSKGVDCDA